VTPPVLPPFWSLVDAHGGELLVHARRLCGDDAEDVLQDALLRALRAYPRLRHAEHLRAWLYRVTTTTAFDHLDRRRVRRAETLHADPPDIAVAALDDPDHLDGTFEALIAELPDAARDALRLRFVDDLDYAGIADRLSISPEAARQRVSSAVRTLRKELAT
jgi:RNA polymerase sigma-70 factor (ECF subfamily)